VTAVFNVCVCFLGAFLKKKKMKKKGLFLSFSLSQGSFHDKHLLFRNGDHELVG